jgi:ribosomal protein L40E
LLRHSRLTWLAQKDGFNERDLRIFAGWSATSDMPDTYLHYGEEEVDKKLRKIKGLQSDKESEKEVIERRILEPRICPRCKIKNPATALYCNCGMGLDIKILQEEIDKRNIGDEILNKIVNDPELSKVFTQLIQRAQDIRR